MPILTVTKEMKMSAAHQLPFHHGKCRNLHGHTFVVQLGITGPVQEVQESNSESGMVADFGVAGAFLKWLHDEKFDHKLLNETMNSCPTAERLAVQIGQMAKDRTEAMLPEGCWISHVRVYEEYVTPQCYVQINYPGRGVGQ